MPLHQPLPLSPVVAYGYSQDGKNKGTHMMRMQGPIGRYLAVLAVALGLILGIPGAGSVPLVGSALEAPRADAALVGCYSTPVPGIFRGERGYWWHRICYNTATCQWQVIYTWWTPGNYQ